MTVLQTYQLWIGLGFAVLLTLFLMVAFIQGRRLNDDQRQILRFLCALCAGFAGALITGDALFKMDAQTGQNTKIAVSGTAGCALFFAVWFTFRKVVPPPDAFHFSIPAGWNFKQTVNALARQDGALVEFIGFTDEELVTPLEQRELHTTAAIDALKDIRLLTTNPNAVRVYEVERQNHAYRLRIRT